MILTVFTGISLAVAVGLWSGNRTIVGAHECAKNLDAAAERIAGGDSYLGMCPVTQTPYERGAAANEVCCPAVDRHGGELATFCSTPGARFVEKHPLPTRMKKIGTLVAEIVAGGLVLITVGAHIAFSIAMRGSK